MNETYIQTIRGGIQRVIHLAKDHRTQEPKRCGFKQKFQMESHHTVAKAFVDVDGFEHRAF